MDTIFNKNSEGREEMQKYFPQIPGTVEYNEIEPDVVAAQDEVAKYLGSSVVEKAIAHYLSDDFRKSTEGLAADEIKRLKRLDTLTELTQNAVTLWAYRDFARNKDATHTSTGRVARMDKGQDEINLKLIDADDLALMQKALKAMDRLIKFVDAEQFVEWTSSQVYKETRELLIWNADLFEKYFPIERNRRVFLLLAPMIRKVQIDRIVPRLGKDAFNALLGKVQLVAVENIETSEESGSGSGSGGILVELTDDEMYLYDLIGYAVAEFAMAEAYLKLPTQLFTEAMSQRFWNAGNGASALTLREKLIGDLERKGTESLARLESELERRIAVETVTPITDDSIVDIADRMNVVNLYLRV